MITPRYLNVLRKIYTRLNDSVNWVVTGSPGFALQNVPVKTHDIYIQTYKERAYEIEHGRSHVASFNFLHEISFGCLA